MSKFVLVNSLPATLVAINEEVAGKISELTLKAKGLAVNDLESHALADAVMAALHLLRKDIRANHDLVKAPVWALCTQLDQVCRDAISVIDAEHTALGLRQKAWKDAENERREAANRAAREEHQRRQAEEDARAEAERQAVLAAQAKDIDWNIPPDVEAPPVETAAVALPQRIIPPPMLKPIVSKAARPKTDYRVAVNDLSMIPAEVAGAKLWDLNLPLCKKLMISGIKIPGLELITETSIAAKPARA